MFLPRSRGPISQQLCAQLSGEPCGLEAVDDDVLDPLADDDLQLALWISYELHYRGFEDVPDDLEWDTGVLAFRASLETRFVAALRARVTAPASTAGVPDRLKALVAADDGPPLSHYLERRATREQFEEFVIHRSIYHVKEADPHSWAIPRLDGAAKVALVAIQADEYGNGMRERMHAELFRSTMRSLGLDDGYGRYLDDVPGVTLAISNLISLFGLHRSWRGALVGHLAAFEMTSSLPNRSYSRALRRLGGDVSSRRFYDEHVTADALHEQVAAYDLCGGLIAHEPGLAEDVLFGAACGLYLDARFATHVLSRWKEGRSSLLPTHPPAMTAS